MHDRIIFFRPMLVFLANVFFFFLKKCDGYRCILLLHVDRLLYVNQIIESRRIE